MLHLLRILMTSISITYLILNSREGMLWTFTKLRISKRHYKTRPL